MRGKGKEVKTRDHEITIRISTMEPEDTADVAAMVIADFCRLYNLIPDDNREKCKVIDFKLDTSRKLN
jgi:hypothetical protein